MKPGDEVWVILRGQVRKGVVESMPGSHFQALNVFWVTVNAFGYDFAPDELFRTEKEAIEALISRQTDKYAEQTQQHNDLIGLLAARLEDL